MKARTREGGDPSAPGRLQRLFQSEIRSLVKRAEKDPYVRNRIEELRRKSPDLLTRVPAVSFSGRERNPLFHNRGDGTFVEIGSAIGLGRIEDGRGMVVADLDGDGDGDVLLHNYYRNPLVVLRNDTHERPPMIVVRLRGTRSNRFGIGARVVVREGDRVQTQELSAGSGFLSGNPPELYFAVREEATVHVRWPMGEWQEIPRVATRTRLVVTERRREALREKLSPGRTGEEPVVPKAPLRTGDRWPLAGGKGTKIVVLYRLHCNACREELERWKEFEARVGKMPGTRLVWKSVGGDPDDLFLRLRREGIRIDADVLAEGEIGKVFPGGEPVVPAVFIVGPDDRVRARFVGPGALDAALHP